MNGSSRAAAGRTAGGSANDRIFFLATAQFVEQNADIPVLGRGGRNAGLQGSLPGQSSTALPSLERISERIVAQNVDFPAGGGLQDFLPGQSSSSSSHVPARVSGVVDEPGDWVFRTFLPIFFQKKVRSWARTRGRNCSPSRAHPRRELMWTPGSMAMMSGSVLTPCKGHFGKSCCQTTFSGSRRGNGADGSMVASGVWCGSLVVAERQERSWLVLLLLVYPLTHWLGAAAGAGCARVLPVSLGGLWKNFLFYVVASSRTSHMESVQYLFPCPCVWQSLFHASRCCL